MTSPPSPPVSIRLIAVGSACQQALAGGAVFSAGFAEPADLLAELQADELPAAVSAVTLMLVDAGELLATTEPSRALLATRQARGRLRILALRGSEPVDWSLAKPLSVDEVLPSPLQTVELSAVLARWGELLNLRAAQTITDSLMATVGDAVMLTDAQDRITWVNAQFCALTGYTLAEVLGRPPAFMRVGRHQAQELLELHEALRSTGSWRGEIWNRKKSGEVYAEWLSVTALNGAEGGPLGYLSVLTDITERKMLESDLRRLAYHDALTGLPNRLLLEDRIQTAMVAAQRHRGSLALMVLDLDGFKAANDRHGHGFGDQILVEVARRLGGVIRASDTVARLGGDEFVCLLVDQRSLADIQRVRDKVREQIERPYDFDGEQAAIGCSIGLAHHPGDGANAAALLAVADARMYEDKRRRGAGR